MGSGGLRVMAMRWSTWDGRCGRHLGLQFLGLDLDCRNPVGRFRYARTGWCGRCWTIPSPHERLAS